VFGILESVHASPAQSRLPSLQRFWVVHTLTATTGSLL
jgi:hypothetical protein